MPKRRAVKKWKFPSESDPSKPPYTTTLWEDGTYSCNCPAWVFVKKGHPRGCLHTEGCKVSEAVREGRQSVAVTVKIPLPTLIEPPVSKRRIILED